MRVVGIDGCRGGWVGVALSEHVTAVTGPTIGAILVEIGPVDVVTIDIPIGIPVDGRRAADLAARNFLASRRSTVFCTPTREVLQARSLREAIAISRARSGVGISAQAYALRSRVLEVDEWVRTATVDVREVHPEVSFGHMSDRCEPLVTSKRTWNGVHERLALLAAEGIELPGQLGLAGSIAGIDDVTDAAAAAWTARRVALDQAVSFPSPPEPLDGWAAAVWA